MPSKYFAHSANQVGEWHPLAEHVRRVGEFAATLADKGCPALKDAAYWAGILHDLGKYRDEF
jgi:CRISPR-associated endonuclease/helicase Cas3